MHPSVIDPIDYARYRAEQTPLVVPIEGENEYCVRSLTDLFVFYYDCPILSRLKNHDRRGYVRRWINKTIRLIEERGFVGMAVYLADCGNLFLHSLTIEDACTYTHDVRLDELPFAQALRHIQSPQQNVLLVRWVLSACFLLSKLPISRPDLDKKETQEWIDRQASVKKLCDMDPSVIEGMRVAIAWLYDVPFTDEHEGKHGPGSTRTGAKTVPAKEREFYHSEQTARITSYRSGDISQRSSRNLNARFILVKKSMKSLRPITAEWAPLQFAQQKLKREMYEAIDSKFVNAGLFIKFADQTRSQHLAIMGSRPFLSDSKPITVDLSSASDLLSAELVSATFPQLIVEELMCSRSPAVDVGDVAVETSMFAGMGSAVTFPVQTIVFTAVCLLAVTSSLYQKIFGHKVTYVEALREFLAQDLNRQRDVLRYFRNICVYGDDIIVPDIATTELFFLLEDLGLKVNRAKSFFGNSGCREACGTFAFAGEDITPVRFRIPVWERYADYAVVESVRTHANLAFMHGYTHLYRSRVRLLKNLKLFVSKKERRRKKIEVKHNGKLVTCMQLDAPSILFEEYRGDSADYIGVLSTRPSRYESGTVFGENRGCLTWWSSEVKNDVDDCEEYHLLQNLYLSSRRDPDAIRKAETAHGKIPRGIRLVKRIAYRRSDRQGWAWVPGQG